MDITLTIPGELDEVYTWFQQQNGKDWAVNFLVSKLEELKVRYEQWQLQQAKTAFDLLSKEDQDVVLGKLNMKKEG